MGRYERRMLLLRNRTHLLRVEYKVITCGGAFMLLLLLFDQDKEQKNSDSCLI